MRTLAAIAALCAAPPILLLAAPLAGPVPGIVCYAAALILALWVLEPERQGSWRTGVLAGAFIGALRLGALVAMSALRPPGPDALLAGAAISALTLLAATAVLGWMVGARLGTGGRTALAAGITVAASGLAPMLAGLSALASAAPAAALLALLSPLAGGAVAAAALRAGALRSAARSSIERR